MSIKDFQVSNSLNVDTFSIDPSGAIDSQSLVYDGTSYIPDDIVPVGTIEMWAGGPTPPNGWLLCNGQSYSWSQYTRLRDVIGISYGGSIDTSWSVPNLVSSTSSVTPVGVAAGGSLGSSTKLFASASTSHSHNYSSSNYGSNTNGYGNHYHDTGNANDHSHTLDFNNWSHFHNSNVPSNTHFHNYFRGNQTGIVTSSVAHGTHNVSTQNHAHSHNLGAVGHNHEHGYDPAMGTHSHNWNMSGIGSNAAGANHTHTVNKQSIYFIIKY
jgi:microcystin-dependent protein